MTNNCIPVIRQSLGEEWDQLDDAVKRHYDLVPGTDEEIILNGTMTEVYHSLIGKLFLMPGRLFGALVPYKGRNIPAQVRNWTAASNSRAMFWYRTFYFPGRKPFIFQSCMEHLEGNELIELVRHGMGIRMRVRVEDGALVYESTTIFGVRVKTL
jgi:hypothetical protein